MGIRGEDQPWPDYVHYSYDLDHLVDQKDIVPDEDVFVLFAHRTHGYASPLALERG